MTPKQFWDANSKDRIRDVSAAAGTSYANFQQIAIAGGSVGKRLAERLARASDDEMTEMEILYPERYNEENSSAA